MIWELGKFSENVAVTDDDDISLTYHQLNEYGNELSIQLKKRALVFCLCSNTIGSLIGYVSFLNNGHIPLLVDQNMDKVLVKHFVDSYTPDYYWVPDEKSGNFPGKVRFSIFGYQLIESETPCRYPIHDDLALLLTTSGSTGSPKLVRQSYENIIQNTRSIVEYLDLDKNEKPITTLPMNYTYGLSIINTHLFVGANIILTKKTLFDREFWDLIIRHRVTSFSGVPYTYEMLDRLLFFRRKLPSLHTLTQAGGKLLPELQRKFAEYAKKEGKKFIVMYGACEATARMSYLPSEYAVEKYGSMGIAIPGGSFYLIDDAGKIITEPNMVGELVYKGKNVTLGYAENGRDLIRGDERNGILFTGDMAKVDKDGFYYIVGRKKRFLKIFGNRVGLDETERLIKERWNGLECACSGKDDKMYVFITDFSKKEELKHFLSEKMRLNPVAFNLICLDKIPKNNAGKTLYMELEKYYE